MQVTVADVSSIKRRLDIAVTADAVSGELDRVVRELGKRVRVPGFRPGKTPLGLVEKRFWDEVRREVEEQLIERSLIQAVQSRDLAMVGTSSIQPGTLRRGEEYRFSAEIEIRPEIALGRYTGLALDHQAPALDEAEIDAELERLRATRKNFVPVTDRSTAQRGDLLVLNYTMTSGASLLSEQDNVNVPLGEGHFLPDGEALLIGKEVPFELQQEVAYPSDFGHRDLAGKTVSLKLRALELKRVELPALDDALAESLGHDDLAALRASVRSHREQDAQREARQALEDKLIEQLIAAHPFEVPASMVQSRLRHMIQGALQQLSYLGPQFASQLTPELYQKLSADFQPRAEREVRANLLLTDIAAAEGLTITEHEVDAELQRIASGAGQALEAVRAQFQKEQALDGLRLMLVRKKTIDWLLERSAIGGAAPAVAHTDKPRPKRAARSSATPEAAVGAGALAADEDNAKDGDVPSEEEVMPVAKKKTAKKAPAKKVAKKPAKKAKKK